MEPLRVYRGINALDVAPTRLLIGMHVVAEANANHVVHTKYFVDGLWDGSLGLTL